MKKRLIVILLLVVLALAVCLSACNKECDHAFVDGKCTKCNYLCPHQIDKEHICEKCGYHVYSRGLEYTLSQDGSFYVVTGIGSCSDRHIVIPQKHENLPVADYTTQAFEYARNITSIVLPSSLKMVHIDSFNGFSNLKSVTIPATVEIIATRAFYGCPLEQIIYLGTVSQWQAVVKGNEWNVGSANYTVVCSDGTVTKSGTVATY